MEVSVDGSNVEGSRWKFRWKFRWMALMSKGLGGSFVDGSNVEGSRWKFRWMGCSISGLL